MSFISFGILCIKLTDDNLMMVICAFDAFMVKHQIVHLGLTVQWKSGQCKNNTESLGVSRFISYWDPMKVVWGSAVDILVVDL